LERDIESGCGVKIRLDKSACAGHALCNSVDAALFPLDDDGYSVVEAHDVRPADEQLTREGADVCPERALVIEDE
jgi:ferredoxin